MDYKYYSPEEIFGTHGMIYQLSEIIKKSRFDPDVLIGVSRGGLPIATYLSGLLKRQEVYAIRAKKYKTENYEGVESANTEVEISQDVDENKVRNKLVLLVDDVADKGDTLKKVYETTENKGPKELRVATLHYKSGSIFEPDYSVVLTKKWIWIIYSWEPDESALKIAKELKSRGKLIDALKRSGMPKDLRQRVLRDNEIALQEIFIEKTQEQIQAYTHIKKLMYIPKELYQRFL